MRLQADQLREVAPGIFYPPDATGLVDTDASIVSHLREAAASNPSRRARLCAHPDSDAVQQDMLIVSHRDTYVCPHRHLNKSETMLVIDGMAAAMLFDDAGNLESTLQMGPLASGRTCFYRMPPGKYHGLRIESEFLTFVECTRGPFRTGDSEDACWAPPKNDIEAGRTFVDKVISRGVGGAPPGD